MARKGQSDQAHAAMKPGESMFSKTRIAAAAFACGAGLAAGGTAAVASQSGTATPRAATAHLTTPRCLPAQLSTGVHGEEGGVGNRGFILTLTNTANLSCSMYGYPGLGLENASHQVLPSHTFWGSNYFFHDPGRSLIVLSPGETASAGFTYHISFGSTPQSVATYLEVTPPNDYMPLRVRLPDAPVGIYAGDLYVTAMARQTAY
jgi:hypothetical protein